MTSFCRKIVRSSGQNASVEWLDFRVLTAKAQYSLNNAEKYFKEHLSAGDYYAEGKHVPGEWFGAGAEKLNLRGKVGMDDFVKLCHNVNPSNDERLTQRQKANRRVFYDFTLSPPKSVSIVALVGGDRRVEESHYRAARFAVSELEKFAAARVRKNRASSYRATGNVVGAMFQHDTSRALDPHLHCHCIIFNATRDQVEDRWKALETYEMLSACKYAENVYYHELARDLRRFGYELENNRRGDFEVKGIPQELIQRFSKRHNEIDQRTKELLEAEPEKRNGNVKDICEEEVKEHANKVLASLRSNLGYGIKDVDRSIAGDSASLKTKDFDVNIGISQCDDEPDTYALRTEITNFRNPPVVGTPEFNQAVSRFVDTLELQLPSKFDVEDMIARLEKSAMKDSVGIDYDAELSNVEIQFDTGVSLRFKDGLCEVTTDKKTSPLGSSGTP